MEKHFLLTIGDDTSSLHAVRFTGHFFANKTTVKVTLLYIAPNPNTGQYSTPASSQEARESNTLSTIYRQRGKEALARAGEMLIQAGHPPENISTVLKFRHFGTVKDIIQEAEIGMYDAIVLGRRGVSRIEELIQSSVSKQMLEEDVATPFWICREPEMDRKNVLLCVEGSDPALRIADHVGFVLEDQMHEITVFNVGNEGRDEAVKVLQQAEQALLENNIKKGRITLKTIEAGDVAQAILDEAHRGQYAVVAVGTAGQAQGFLNRLRSGSVCGKLVSSMRGAALWVSK